MNTHELEGKPLWKLTDKQVLDAMRGRGNELESARVLDSLCRIFATAARSNPACAAGLNSAIGLTQMYGLKLAPGHEDHPFRNVDKNLNIASIMAGEYQPAIKLDAPEPIRRSQPKHRVFDLDKHMEGERALVGRPTSDEFGGAAMALEGISKGTVTTTLRSVQNVPRQRREGPSKVSIVVALIEAFQGDELNPKAILAQCPEHFKLQDVQNGFAAMKKAGKLTSPEYGRYQRVGIAA